RRLGRAGAGGRFGRRGRPVEQDGGARQGRGAQGGRGPQDPAPAYRQRPAGGRAGCAWAVVGGLLHSFTSRGLRRSTLYSATSTESRGPGAGYSVLRTRYSGRPSPLRSTTTRSTGPPAKTSSWPSGQRTWMASTLSALPRPKWARGSLLHR